MVITEWAEQDRPREKMMANGPASLTEVELLAILINTGQRGKTAVDIARELMFHTGNSLMTLAHTLLQGDDDERKAMLKGIGPAKMCVIQAALELGRRHQNEIQQYTDSRFRITSSTDLFNIFNRQLSDLDYEELWAVYCSNSGKILYKKRISEGGVNFSGADIKKICRPAIEYMASNVALCHNHPHSSTHPSRADIDLTQKVKQALTTIDVRLFEHIIISDGQYYSMSENGDF
ncbi:MAG: DNA repair protein RadC [Bacteroidales bacterium]|nr:DNA repair protein RadC [Candidatus Liminaster caballi]